MAQYRLSVNIIGRSSGRSATGAAAYRAAARIEDERTGLIHDYTRKGGVLHSEILLPNHTPDWMGDRAQLWNAIEAVERRKDAQLARELQLSLPHELSEQDQVDLVRRYVQEQHVAQGMIADIAIHAPSPHGDERNVHAHVMLTMREVTAGGFGKKVRAWNDRAQIEHWREQWADYQNRELERRGIADRVDHRSYEDQGILREPTFHRGPIASEIERKGRTSRIANDNLDIARRNDDRAALENADRLIDARIAFEKRKFAVWAERKRETQQQEAYASKAEQERDLALKMETLEILMEKTFSDERTHLADQHDYFSQRLESASGLRKLIRDLTLTTRREKLELERLERQKAHIDSIEAEERRHQVLLDQQKRAQLKVDLEQKREALERGIKKAHDKRERENWKYEAGKGVTDPKNRIDRQWEDSHKDDKAALLHKTAHLDHRQQFNTAAKNTPEKEKEIQEWQHDRAQQKRIDEIAERMRKAREERQERNRDRKKPIERDR